MNCSQALRQTRKALKDHSIENSSLEAEILLRHVMGINRAVFLSSLEKELAPAQAEKLANLLERRLRGEPAAYITGHREFYGLDFRVDPRVLIPRPETELLVEKALEICGRYSVSSIVDIGTGSGCIAISLANKLAGVRFYAVDCSQPALEAAKENCTAHGLRERITLLYGNLLEPLPEPVDMIVANLPYVRKAEVDSRYEPDTALDGGEGGLDVIKALIYQVPDKLKPGGFLLLEIGQGQAESIKTNLHKVIPNSIIEVTKDLAGIDRVISLRLTPKL